MYFPNLKTSDAELRAIRNLSESTKDNIIPVFELTRSRKTRALPQGSLVRRLDQVKEIYGNRSFILDLCTQDELMNSETLALFEENEGYANWITFLETNVSPQTIPCVLYDAGGSRENFQQQAISLHRKYGTICLRTAASDEFAPQLLIWLAEVVPDQDIFLCGILYYIEHGKLPYYKNLCRDFITDVVGNRTPKAIMLPGSSFPRYITDLPNCEDDTGSFRSDELTLDQWLDQQFPTRHIQPSDFAAIHPIRYPASGGNWIPRIDVFNGSGFLYVRTRRDDGGYADAARAIANSTIAQIPDCWGKQQIQSAKLGTVNGGSPSFWISVRVNCWITARATPHGA